MRRGRHPTYAPGARQARGRHRKALSLYRLAFEDAVSGLLSAKPAYISEKGGRKAGARPKKTKKGSRRKGSRGRLGVV